MIECFEITPRGLAEAMIADIEREDAMKQWVDSWVDSSSKSRRQFMIEQCDWWLEYASEVSNDFMDSATARILRDDVLAMKMLIERPEEGDMTNAEYCRKHFGT